MVTRSWRLPLRPWGMATPLFSIQRPMDMLRPLMMTLMLLFHFLLLLQPAWRSN